MTPAARIQAAIECLDAILAGAPAEQVLTRWARASRFAGSKDRAAVRDHVFDALRCRRSHAARGGGEDGRAILLGALRAQGAEPDRLFTGEGHAPAPLSPAERAGGRAPRPGAEAADLPDWLWQRFQASLGERAGAVARALRQRAPVHLRANAARLSRAEARMRLAEEGIETVEHPASATALEVVSGARRLRASRSYAEGLVELQDAASQAVVDGLPLSPGMRVLDYCAGGGGKTLAMAARGGLTLFAHDAAPQRLRSLTERAARAGAEIACLATAELAGAGPFDLVLCDVPCSGSGAWRRAPDGKWRLSPDGLERLIGVQREILRQAAALVAPGGVLAYATCSVLHEENAGQIEWAATALPGFAPAGRAAWLPDAGTDGFFAAHLTRAPAGG